MHKITFLPGNKTGAVNDGETVLEVAGRLGVELNHECGGVASCSTCRVQVSGENGASVLSQIEIDEQEVLEREALGGNYRLACQAKVHGNVTILVPPPAEVLADGALREKR